MAKALDHSADCNVSSNRYQACVLESYRQNEVPGVIRGEFSVRRIATRALKSRGNTKAIRRHGVPEKPTIDGSEANAAAIRGYNEAHGTAIIIRQVKYLNNAVEIWH